MIKCFLTILILIFIPKNSHSQNYLKKFIKLSYPEKIWVISHPFVANKSYEISNNSITKTAYYSNYFKLDKFNSCGTTDAFRHAYWMAILSQNIGRKKALLLGKAHEKGNYIQFKKGKLEDGILPDYASCEMDLFNNTIGAGIGILYKKITEDSIAKIIYSSIENGDLRIIKRNSKGEFLNCKNEIVELSKKWYSDRCIVPSNYKYE